MKELSELKNEFYDVMYKYEKSFSEDGVMADLTAWQTAKADLISLLRCHPDWNETEQAIIFDCNQALSIQPDMVDETAFTLLDIASEILSGEQLEDFRAALHAAVSGYRQMFFYKDGTLYQSRLYPADTGNALEVSKLFRHLVQKAISRCLTEPNLWYLKTKRSDLDAHYSTRRGSLHYPDYDFHGNLSILQGHKKDTVLPIGAVALCVCCGNELWSNGDIKCSCKEVVVCRKCGQTVARDQGIYLEDGFYCKTCLHICEACGRPTLGTMYPAYDRRGSLLQICHDCYQQLTASCSSCSMAAACRTMGFTICKKATIPVAA